jgi:hypothetical protein
MSTLQRLVLFPRFAVRPDRDAGARVRGLERVWHESPQGRVEAWFLAGDGVSAQTPGPVVLFAHGNGELIEHWPEMLDHYRRLGVSLFLPEYRGYGRSAGEPSEPAIRDDFLAFHRALMKRPDVDPTRVVLHGRSLGGGAVCAIAREHPPTALVLMSTFTSVDDVASGWMVPRALISDHFDNLSVVRSLERPILVVHGRRDRVVPFSHGQKLAQSNPRARLVAVDADHNDCPPHWPSFWQEIEAFLRETGVLA